MQGVGAWSLQPACVSLGSCVPFSRVLSERRRLSWVLNGLSLTISLATPGPGGMGEVSLPDRHAALTPRLRDSFHSRTCQCPEKKRDLHQIVPSPCAGCDPQPLSFFRTGSRRTLGWAEVCFLSGWPFPAH